MFEVWTRNIIIKIIGIVYVIVRFKRRHNIGAVPSTLDTFEYTIVYNIILLYLIQFQV